ncbi:chorismate-binding protein [Halothiobacillus sp. DCM-1]|uniref:chorismate-binding protein n=1 Tax=Halothiobacillus sp. DCM-1 TaxID=3112558 RepID=UPI003246573F
MTGAVVTPVIEPLPGVVARDLPELLAAYPDLFAHLYASLARGHAGTSGAANARWSILFSRAVRECRALPGRNFLADWADAIQAAPVASAASLPFVGGWSFYLGYELGAQIEPSLRLPAFESGEAAGFPLAVAQYHPAAIVYDHQAECAWLVQDGAHPEIAAALRATVTPLKPLPRPLSEAGSVRIEGLMVDAPDAFEAGVARVKAYLFAGDVFQANLSRAWRFRAPEPDAGARIFTALARQNPAPFAAWYRLPEGEILSSSPERLVNHQAGAVSVRPIAGTRRRVADATEDAALVAELRAHPKERAEHIMLIDLARNDLGRVCQPGSVVVDELMVVESFAHVHHLVSNVTGRLAAGRTVLDVLAAVFPGGTITGCPKVRCMEILAELEDTGRGPYTGSLGYLSLDGQMDSNILIRTVFLAADGRGEFRTGAGIVADSDPVRERVETEEKARGLLLALSAGR